MQATETDLDLAATDLGPLAWVLDELRKSLDAASGALRRFVRDSGLARGSDMASLDGGQLRIARQQLHQAVGALEMVGQGGPAQVLRSMEAAVQKFIERPELCTEASAAKVERTGFALTDFLESLLLGKSASAVALFSQYRDTQELAGADRSHPADLWSLEWRWEEPAATPAAETLVSAPAVRSRMDTAVLRLMKTGDAQAARELAGVSLGLAAAQTARQPRIFWKVSAGFFEAAALQLLPLDIYVKRAATRVLLQYASLARGDHGVSDRLVQDLVFFCSQAVPARAGDAPALHSVRLAWRLDRFRPVDYQTAQYGRFDPVLLGQARKRIAAAKDTWSALSGGEASKLRGLSDQFRHLSDALVKLYARSAPLAQALSNVVDTVVRSSRPPAAELAMEVATAVLYLEAALQDLDPADTQLAQRIVRLAERLETVRGGAQPEPLEHWMEELYRRVSDRQTMGSVVGELRSTLSELEKLLDQFFRDPADKGPLREAPGYLSQMRGVLSVLGLEQAAQAVLHMRDTVEEIIVTEIDAERVHTAGTFEKLGNNVGALGFLIDMLNYQPLLAKKLFVYDEARAELRPLMGRVGHAANEALSVAADELSRDVGAAADAPDTGGAREKLTARLDTLATQAALAEQPGIAQTARAAAAALSAHGTQAAAAALSTLSAALKTEPAATPEPAAAAGIEEDDLLGIFLDEAREVVQNGLAAIQALAVHPAEVAELTILRRAFHTLKGSSRMVGLTEFGEAAWALEQVLNTWLADQKPATPALLALSGEAMNGFSRWVEDAAAHKDGAWKASIFRGPADALRTENRVVALVLPDAAALAEPAPRATAQELQGPVAFDLGPTVPESATAPEVSPVDLGLGAAPAPASTEAPPPSAIDFDFGDQAVAQPPETPAAIEFELPLADELAPAGVDEAAEPVHPGVAEAAEAPVAVDAPFVPDFDFGLPAPEASAPELLPPASDLALDIEGIDLSALGAMSDQAVPAVPEEAASEEPAAAPGAAGLEVSDTPMEDLALDLSDFGLAQPEARPDKATLNEAATAPPGGQEPLVGAAPEPGPLGEPLLEETLDLGEEESGGAEDEDQVKVIGPLRIGIPLYNVYLNEADEWSRRLATELAEWALELNQPVADSTVGLAHALAGSSATVGFQVLSDIARALEHTLQRTQWLASATPRHGQAFVDAAEEIRRLLHQFAAGFLKEANPAIVEALLALDEAPVSQSPEVSQDSTFSGVRQPEPWAPSVPDLAFDGREEAAAPAAAEKAAEQVAEPVPPVEEPVAFDEAAATLAGAAPEEVGAIEEPPATEQAAPEEAGATATATWKAPVQVVDHGAYQKEAAESEDPEHEDIDVADVVDADLFGIFEEEAQELLPQLGGALRQWAARPDNRSARDEVLRALHTLKGSARLAGALRLGELAHRMESRIESLGWEDVAFSTADLEPLLHRFDGLQAGFDGVRALANATAALPVPEEQLPPVPGEAATGGPPATGAEAVPQGPAAGPAPRILPVERRATPRAAGGVRVRAELLDRLVNQAGEVMITRTRLEAEVRQMRASLADLTGNLDRLRAQLRDIELQAESQMQSRLAQARDSAAGFDPLEFDRFTRVQELTRMMAESVNDVATVQRSLQRTVEASEDNLVAQARQTRELQRDLLRTRMVEFESIADRLYRVIRLASKETGKQVKLDITGGSIEMDRGVLDRMTPAFEHLLRNCVAHGIEAPALRAAAGKDPTGTVVISLHQEGNDVSVAFRDDGAGMNLAAIREQAVRQRLVAEGQQLTDAEAAELVFRPGFSTASQVTELAGRGIGMDVVRAEVNALGGRIETSTAPGQGTTFKLVLPLTTAVTQVVMIRSGSLTVGVPANVVEIVRRAPAAEIRQAYETGCYELGPDRLPFYWSGALLQASRGSSEPPAKTTPVVVIRSAAQRIAIHVDEVLGNQEVVVKNLGPQLARLPGLAGMTVLASGAVVLIYNPVALSTVYGEQARQLSADSAETKLPLPTGAGTPTSPTVGPAAALIPLVLVVDDSITVRRVTQRLLQREGYRVALAADGLQALERLAEEIPAVVLSDIEMPRMDGFDLARNIRGDRRLKHLPIVMITSRIAEKHREHAKELGVDHYLGKPYSEEELLSLVKHYSAAAAQV